MRSEIDKAILKATVKVSPDKVKYIKVLPGMCVFVRSDECVWVIAHDTIYQLNVNLNGGFDISSTSESTGSTGNTVHYTTLSAFCEAMGLQMYQTSRIQIAYNRALNRELGAGMGVFTVPEGYIITKCSSESGEYFTYTGAGYIDHIDYPCPLFTDITELREYIRSYNTLR